MQHPGPVLIRASTVPAQVAYPGCKVLAGRWVDSYTGTAYEDLTKLSIDHLVPLKQAWSQTGDARRGRRPTSDVHALVI